MRLAAAAIAAALLCGCASNPGGPGAYAFAVIGDTPYNPREEVQFLAMMERLDREALEFVVHVGDFKAGSNAPCTDEVFVRRHAQFDRSAHPFILTPGDNDWTDCRRKSNGAMDPSERLARLREIFFATPQSLGRTRIDTDAQARCIAAPPPGCGCAAHPENRAWTRGGVRFATLNFPGSDNNTGVDAAGDLEALCRNEANRQWLERAVAATADPAMRALVVAIQANPWDSRKPVYAAFVAQMEAAARTLRKPVLFIHGDTHTYRVDAPFAGANLRRLETYGSPLVGWVKVTVDPGDPAVFRFEPHLHAMVPPGL